MLNSIVNFSIISSIFTCSVKTIRRIKLNYDQHGSVEDLPRSGRPSVTTEREKRRIVRKHKRNRFLTAAETSHGERNSERTVRRLLRSSGIHCRRPLRRPILTSRRRQARLRWAISKSSWTVEDWAKILFSDEPCFCLNADSRSERLWRANGTRYSRRNVHEFRSKGLMIWGGISREHKSNLVLVVGTLNAERYISDVLQAEVLPFLRETPDVFALQQDNAPTHVASSTLSYLRDQNIMLLSWPPFSPDLNPIEHVWAWMKKRVGQKNPQNLMDLAIAILEVWRTLPKKLSKKVD